MSEQENHLGKPPTTFCFRSPKQDELELCISVRGQLFVISVTLDQAKLGAYQLAKFVKDYPA